ncbi:Hypothetical predicted protein, partial [Olea europaea subsp. europaea]
MTLFPLSFHADFSSLSTPLYPNRSIDTLSGAALKVVGIAMQRCRRPPIIATALFTVHGQFTDLRSPFLDHHCDF